MECWSGTLSKLLKSLWTRVQKDQAPASTSRLSDMGRQLQTALSSNRPDLLHHPFHTRLQWAASFSLSVIQIADHHHNHKRDSNTSDETKDIVNTTNASISSTVLA